MSADQIRSAILGIYLSAILHEAEYEITAFLPGSLYCVSFGRNEVRRAFFFYSSEELPRRGGDLCRLRGQDVPPFTRTALDSLFSSLFNH